MAELVQGSDELYLAGHSMGGLVGILMASGWFGVAPKAVVTAGVKIDWTEKEYLSLKSSLKCLCAGSKRKAKRVRGSY